jgi:glycosyltransferase involved in cell wall biosynthesis
VKVLYFTRGFGPHDLRFLNALAETSHTVDYLPLINEKWDQARSELPSNVRINEPLHGAGAPGWWQYPVLVRRLRDILGRVEPDLVHAGPIHLNAALTALADFHPLVSMSWGSDLLWETRNPWVAVRARYALAQSDAFVGDCTAVKDAALRYGMDGDRIVLFPWGVDLDHFKPGSEHRLRESLGWESRFILLSSRSFEPLYGVDLLVKAFIQIAPHHANLRLLLLGEGSQRDDIKTWLKDADLLERVHFAGIVDRHRLPAYYRSANIYVSASHSDGSSVSLLEALACGIPALVSDIPGNCEWIVPGVNGWRFRDGDANSLITTLDTLLQGPDRLGELGVVARSIAEKSANWVENFPKLLEAYQIASDHADKGSI